MTRILQGMGISRKFFLAFVGLLMVCQLVVGFKPPKDIGFSFLTHKKENKIYITYYDGTTINILGTYGYMDNPERYVSYYKNKSWIGCLPKEASSNISDSGNKSSLQSFIVFFANVATKDVITLTEIKEVESPEYLFHILDIGNEQQKLGELSAEGVNMKNVRKNQQQVDANGNKVGTNRPDLQWTDNEGKRHYWEIDRSKSTSKKHGETIRRNDPSGIVHLEILE